MKLRKYQKCAVDSVFKKWGEKTRSTMLVCATGTGKTVMMAAVARKAFEGGAKRILLIAHRGELLEQAKDKFEQIVKVKVDIEKASDHAVDGNAPLVVGSVQTLARENRLAEWKPNSFDIVMVDEAHHATSDSYKAIIEYFSSAKILGVTATPDRADRAALGKVFKNIAYEYGIAQAVQDKYLAPIKARMIPLKLNMTNVGMQSGDFAAGQVGHALDKYLPALADAIKENAENRKVVVFLPLVSTAKRMAKALGAVGMEAREVDGESKNRQETLEWFDSAPKGSVLCNSMLLTEGWDCPSCDCIVVLRITKSRALYTQMVGRGTRLCPETKKKDLLLLDFLWQTSKHDLCRPAALVSQDPFVQSAITDISGKEDVELTSAVDRVAKDAAEAREMSLLTELERVKARRAKMVNPLEFAMSFGIYDFADYCPRLGWETNPATEENKQLLESMGINGEGISNAQAQKLIGEALYREKLASPKQIRLLSKYGFKNLRCWSKSEATSMVKRIAANGWKAPKGIEPTKYRFGMLKSARAQQAEQARMMKVDINEICRDWR